MAWEFFRNSFYWLGDFLRLKPEERRSLMVRKFRALGRKLRHCLPGRKTPRGFDLEEFIDVANLSQSDYQLWKHHLTLLLRHRSKPYGGRLTLFRTVGQPLICSFARDFGWGELAGSVEVKIVPGSHEHIFVEPQVSVLAGEVRASLDKLQPGGQGPAPK